MQLFAKRYLAALAFMLIGLCAYSLFVVPFIEPEGRKRGVLPKWRSTVGANEWREEFFPEGAWQRDTPLLFQTQRGILLAKDWQQVDEKTLQLSPLTIIIPQSEKGRTKNADSPFANIENKGAWIVSSEKGAVIQFEDAFNVVSGGRVPPIESGKLHGQTRITRKTLGSENGKPWSLETSELIIQRGRVSTQESVTINWENSVIRGRNLRIYLTGDLFNSSSDENGRWGPLDRMELLTIDRVDIGLPDGGFFAGMDLPGDQLPVDTKDLPARMQVTCRGKFAFDFRRSTATLANGVRVIQQLGDLFQDEFACEELKAKITPSDPTSDSLVVNESAGLGDFQLVDLEATGVDKLDRFVGEKKVELNAPSIGAYASAKRLYIDFVDSRVEFDGKLQSAVATQSTAWLKYAGTEFLAPHIEYDANGYDTKADVEHLGYLFADGPGELNIEESDRMGATHIRWRDSLKMSPTKTPGQQWIGIFGNTLVESRNHGHMTADQLDIVLRENSNVAAPPTSRSVAGQNYLPEVINATGNVKIETPKIQLDVNSMQLGLVFVSAGGGANSAASPDENPGPSLQDSAGNPMYQWVSPPGQSNSSFAQAPGGQSAPQTRERLTRIRGTSMTSRFVIAGDNSWIDDMKMQGPLQLDREADTATGSPPLHIEGQSLDLVSNSAGQVNMRIDGAPARIVWADGFLEGPSIAFDQQHNLVWMDHPGEFTVPLNARVTDRPSSAKSDRSIKWINAPFCTWKGGMHFDGRVVHIQGDVEFKATMRAEQQHIWWVEGKSQELQIVLSEPVAFNGEEQNEATIERLELSKQVSIVALQRDNRGHFKNQAHIEVPAITFHASENQVVGHGPGSIHSWHTLERKQQPGKLASASAKTKKELQGSHLTFRDHVVAEMDKSKVVFEGKVEVASGPLQTLKQSIDLYTMNALSTGQMLLACDQLDIYDTSNLSSTARLQSSSRGESWNLQARGNVDFQGKTETGDYAGTGSEIQYIQAKEHLRLKGDRKRPATIRGIRSGDPDHQASYSASVKDAVINPRTREFEVIEIHSAEMKNGPMQGNPPNGQAIPAQPNALDPRSKTNEIFRGGGFRK